MAGRRVSPAGTAASIVNCTGPADAAMLIGAKAAACHVVAGRHLVVYCDACPVDGAAVNAWASALLGFEVRGDVVVAFAPAAKARTGTPFGR